MSASARGATLCKASVSHQGLQIRVAALYGARLAEARRRDTRAHHLTLSAGRLGRGQAGDGVSPQTGLPALPLVLRARPLRSDTENGGTNSGSP